MNDLTSLIDRLKQAGIQPQVTIVVEANTNDVQAIKTLQTNLKNAGILAEVHINLSAGPAAGQTDQPGSANLPISQGRRAVRVKEIRLNCFTYSKVDKAGKPEMTFPQPRIQLQKGVDIIVSANHKVSPKDPGDGTIFATGNIEYYMVVECPANPAAVGFYIRKMDVENTSSG